MEKLQELWETYQKYCIIGICVVIAVVVLLVKPGGQRATTTATTGSNSTHKQLLSKQTSSSQTGTIYVDVKGAVQKPGVYRIRRGLRVKDAIDLAGGALSSADMNHVNMAQEVTDQQVVYVPMPGEVTTPVGQTTGSSADATTSSDGSAKTVVNINTASKEQLTQITGIGDKKADLIIQYRQEHGEFKTVDDLKNVSGFGDKSVAKIKDEISV